MPRESATARAQAIAWHIRLHDGRAGDWEEFAKWLALHPEHSTAYDEVARGDGDLGPALVSWAVPRRVRVGIGARF
jgi:ferric-dicitrate binding protein FerR (iron transport regulator)